MPLQFLEQISFAPIKGIVVSDMLCVSVHKSQCGGMPSLHKNSIFEHTQLRLSFVPICPIGAKHCSAMHGYTSVLGSTIAGQDHQLRRIIHTCTRNTKWVDRFCETSTHTETNTPTQTKCIAPTNIPSEEELEVAMVIFYSL